MLKPVDSVILNAIQLAVASTDLILLHRVKI